MNACTKDWFESSLRYDTIRENSEESRYYTLFIYYEYDE